MLAVPENVFDRIERLLASQAIEYRVLRHAPVFTSAEASAIRGAPLASGAKALICKANGQFVFFVVPADRKLASKPLRSARGWKSFRFADRDEVLGLTGLTPGAIPPFGSLFGLTTLCDERLGEQAVINFNAGDHAISISMSFDDYLRAERPELGRFAE